MDLYIQLKDGEPFEHPIPDWNMKMFFPDLDPSNPPEGFGRFERVPYPELTPTQIVDKINYELSNYYTDLYKTKTWTDVYHVRDLSQEELDKINNDSIPPKPNDGKDYYYDDNLKKWIDSSLAIDVFRPFFKKYNIDFKTFDFETLDGLTPDQKKEFGQLLLQLNKQAAIS